MLLVEKDERKDIKRGKDMIKHEFRDERGCR